MDAPEVAGLDRKALQRFDEHVTSYIGPIACVFHEIASDIVHLDIYKLDPNSARPFYVMLTLNMSALPMSVPEGGRDSRYAELMICLPLTWPLDEGALRDERSWWPLRWLKTIARLPHAEATWLAPGHTVATADPPVPVGESVDFTGFLVCRPDFLPLAQQRVELHPTHEVELLTLVPLYPSEMEFALSRGSAALVNRLRRHQVDQVVRVNRSNVCP